ncbi:MAG TPA: nicotinate-nucleotide adenylyltransferase [Acidimicrobiales bacterium]|nr:nicotinate-nucleotide adenylyltransferase [Acidimicrobiales bacterium]
MPRTPRRERLGLLGGTFDPPHCGHVAAAEAARDQLELDRVLLVVANDPWQKAPLRAVTPAEDRFAMVEAAVEGHRGLEASRMEIDRGGPSYTVDTVEEVRAAAAGRGEAVPAVWLVVGADLVEGLPTWERADELARLVTLAVVTRPRSPEPDVGPAWRWVRVEGRGVDVSSSEVRSWLADGRPVDALVPEAVVRCIRQRDLYAVGR